MDGNVLSTKCYFLFDLASELNLSKVEIDEPKFRWLLNEDQMATDKLSEGIRKFAEDTIKLEQLIISRLQK